MVGEEALLRLDGVSKRFAVRRNLLLRPTSFVHAVDGVSFELMEGETLAVVGESGSGKSTLARLVTKLIDPDAGTISVALAKMNDTHDGGEEPDYRSLADLRGADLRAFRRSVDMVFQDPYEAMNPRRNVLDAVTEPLVIHHEGNGAARKRLATEMLASVSLDTPNYLQRFPHELSGGQRQRIAIARSLILRPKLVVADEPTSMLDVPVSVGIMKLMLELQERWDLTYLYITHNLAIARHMADRIAVMYLGKIVEVAGAEELIRHPRHPYTRALLAAAQPGVAPGDAQITGAMGSAVDPPDRCRFYDRCPFATEACAEQAHPSLVEEEMGHFVACYRSDAIA